MSTNARTITTGGGFAFATSFLGCMCLSTPWWLAIVIASFAFLAGECLIRYMNKRQLAQFQRLLLETA